MSSKWMSDDDEKDDVDTGSSPPTPNSPPSEQKVSEQKDGVTVGRRPRRPRPGRDDTDTADSSKDIDSRPPGKTVAKGWGLDDAGSTNSEAQRKPGHVMEPQQKPIEGGSNRANRRNHFDNEETEILVIPDLEDEGEEDIVSKVAAAPKNTTRRVPSLRQLDDDLKHAIPSGADGLDMSLLTKTLVPPELLEEDDSPWDFDSLLQSVTQEFNAEKISKLDSEGSEADGGARGSNILQGGSSHNLDGTRRSNRALIG